MPIKPISKIQDFLRHQVTIRNNTKKAVNNLHELYGDAIDGYRLYKNKSGVVSALGFSSPNSPYCFSYSIFPNGDEMQKIADYKFTKDGLKKYYTSFLKKTDGNCTLISTVVDEAPLAKSQRTEFTLVQKEPQSIDLKPYLRTLPMPKKMD